ncbi:ribonuclease H-like domain-containing protein [Tanacetum coccineum]
MLSTYVHFVRDLVAAGRVRVLHVHSRYQFADIFTKGLPSALFEEFRITAGQVRVLHVPSRYQFADIFTKGLPSALFKEFRTSLSVRCPPAPTAGEC